MYWLKPFDAVNDAANAWALRQFEWVAPVLEIGAGDGAFSFVMHGGEFRFSDDRYDQADAARADDMFDVYRESGRMAVACRPAMSYLAAVDLKWSHLLKARDGGGYDFLVQSRPAPLPFAAGSFSTVFLYFPHGLVERGEVLRYEEVLPEIRRVLVPHGTLVMIAVNRRVSDYFVCARLARFCERRNWTRPAAYFRRLDAGRAAEIGSAGRSIEEWRTLLEAAGFSIVDAWSQVGPLAWRLYDWQTRPILRTLVRLNGHLRRTGLKRLAKGGWVYAWLPVLRLFYACAARPRRLPADTREVDDVFFAFRAAPQ